LFIILVALCTPTGASADEERHVELSTEVSYHAFPNREDLEHAALKFGFAWWQPNYGFWGNYENIRPRQGLSESDFEHAGELNAVYHFDGFSTQLGVGAGSDYRLRASDQAQIEVSIPLDDWNDNGVIGYLGYMRSQYKAEPATLYEYYRAGAGVRISPMVDVDARLDAIESRDEPRQYQKRGPGVSLAVRVTDDDYSAEGGVLASCLSDSYFCRGSSRDVYAEQHLTFRWRQSAKTSMNVRLLRVSEGEPAWVYGIGFARGF
jgi:hypothetical protein